MRNQKQNQSQRPTQTPAEHYNPEAWREGGGGAMPEARRMIRWHHQHQAELNRQRSTRAAGTRR